MKQILPYVAIAGIAYLILKQVGDMGKGIADAIPKMPDFSAILGKQQENSDQQLTRILDRMDLRYSEMSKQQKVDFEKILGETKAAYQETGTRMTWEKFQSLINKTSDSSSSVAPFRTWEQTKSTFSDLHQAAIREAYNQPRIQPAPAIEVLKVSDAPLSAFERPQNISGGQAWVTYRGYIRGDPKKPTEMFKLVDKNTYQLAAGEYWGMGR